MLPDESRHPANSFVNFSHATDEEGGMSGAEGFLRLATLLRSRTSSPLSRSAGEGPGVRAALTIPPTPQPPSAPMLWARKGEMLPDESRHPASSFVYFSHATDEEGR